MIHPAEAELRILQIKQQGDQRNATKNVALGHLTHRTCTEVRVYMCSCKNTVWGWIQQYLPRYPR